jgi:polyhydroxybutyrate depolymerase
MKLMLRKLFTVLAVTSLLTSLITSYANAALDDGYPEGAAAPGRTCSADAVGQKELSSYSGKNLSCILIFGIAKWWIDGDPLPAAETPAAKPTASAGPAPSAGPTAPASAGNQFVLEKDVKITLKKGSKLIKVGDVRPAQVLIPGTLKSKVAAPLLVALPGFTATPNDLLALVDLTAEAYKRGVVLALPSGSKNSGGLPFWNATGSCCDFEKSGVDDSKYLMDLVKQISAKVSIDAKRVYFFGHSNGGFMSYTAACNNSSKIAALVNFNGSSFADMSLCKADRPVSILQINGTEDELIHIAGGDVFDDPKQPYPSVTVETGKWAEVNGCSTSAALIKNKAKFNYESVLAGSETTKAAYKCPKGVAVEMWTIAGGKHLPKINAAFISSVFDFLLAHKK